jgi:pyruvate dehydrogenase E2 component (dihydrolipoamide acetyltransferase)
MPTNVVMPQMGESIVEGTLTKWLKKPGDRVQRDEPLFEISTDKVDAEIPSPAAGILSKMLVQEGQTVQINTVVAEIEEAGPAPQPAVPPVVEFPGHVEGEAGRSSPLVRRLAAEHGVDLSRIKGAGLGGRVTKSDILSYIEARKRAPAREAAEQPQAVGAPPVAKPAGPEAGAPAAPPRAAAPAAPPSPAPAAPAAYGERIEVVPLSPMRQKIAERMVESRRTAAHVNSVFQVDVTRIVKLREQWKQEFEQRNGVKLTYMPFICRAAISALKAFPTVNASLQGANLLVKKDVNLGIAVALEWGLIVPVVKNADERNFLGLTRAIHDLADRARNKKLSPDDVQGGTFTITNLGQFGAMFGLPIIPQPQLAILGVGSIHKEPVVIDDAIAIGSIVYLSLSYDHRAIDGALADQFMAHVKQVLENWEEPIL